MFTQIFTELEQGKPVNHDLLQRRFDLAITKKFGVIKLPPAFWMQDSKINPRADHLLQAALLLGDRERYGLAVSALAVEIAEKSNGQPLQQVVREITDALLTKAPDNIKDQLTAFSKEVCL